ncbi:hypothetical protein, partial [Rhizobium leguminosarum]|uniref:hypothetical protein n=1 Tax=Rhizobium leguminosarum TaxID=384 RepID=UPI003F9B19C0
LFIIGLELKPTRLWHMRRDIFGLGTAQVVLTGLPACSPPSKEIVSMSAPNAFFSETILLLGGAVLAAPIFKKLGLGTVLGYLAAGIVICPVFHG